MRNKELISNLIDMEKKNWLACQTCNKICKCPNYDYDLRLDECCLCSDTDVTCSACYERKLVSIKAK